MEELLNKDIFNDSKLLKYGPDYNSSDIHLWLQLRRERVKDSHKHKPLSKTRPKTIIKHKVFNNTYKVNNEIAKVHSFFRHNEAKNKLMLKNLKKQHTWKNNTLKFNKHCFEKSEDNIETKIVEAELYSLLQSSQEISDLKIENDSNFVLQQKIDQKNNYGNNKLANNYDLLNKHQKQPPDDLHKLRAGDESENRFYCSFKKNDLQSLLIMMTVSSNYTSSEQETEDDNSNHNLINNTVDDINDEPSLKTICKVGSYNFLKISSVMNTNVSADRKRYIERKYFEKWKEYIKMKADKIVKHQRKESLNKFLDKLSKTKNIANNTDQPVQRAKMLVRDYNNYHHRYKVQKHIIALQKAKLEHQNKVIEELKYNKIIEASRQSLDCMKDDVRKAYYELDKHLKPKIKCLTNELNIKEIEEPSLILHCLKVPQFLQRMEARAREREEKHAIIRERRKQMEEERLRLKQQAELAKAVMDKDEKLKRIKELKEKRRKDKLENIRKKQYAERIRALIVMADLHYEKNLLVKYGLRPFQRLIQIKNENIEKARTHYKFQLMKNVFLHWMFYTEDMWYERNYIAEENYRKKLLRKAFSALRKNHHNYILKMQVAEDYYDLYLTQLVFRKFRENIEIVKQEFQLKEIKAVNYHECNLLFKTFTCWRSLPALNALRREQEARKLKWREKVLQVVPDYKPPDD